MAPLCKLLDPPVRLWASAPTVTNSWLRPCRGGDALHKSHVSHIRFNANTKLLPRPPECKILHAIFQNFSRVIPRGGRGRPLHYTHLPVRNFKRPLNGFSPCYGAIEIVVIIIIMAFGRTLRDSRRQTNTSPQLQPIHHSIPKS